MKKLIALTVVALVAAIMAGPALAGKKSKTVTLEGHVLCAKCALHEEGRDQCQNVLVVEEKGEKTQYYMAKNETNDDFGEVCRASPSVRVTGKIKKQDGQAWIYASKIEPVEDDKG